MTHHPMNPASVYRRRSLYETRRWFNRLLERDMPSIAKAWAQRSRQRRARA